MNGSSLREMIVQHPGAMGLTLLAWVAIATWIVSLSLWAISGEVDSRFAIAGIGIGVGLGYLAFNPPTEAWRPFIAAVTVAGVVLYPLYQRMTSERALRIVDQHALKHAYEVLSDNRSSPSLRFRVAELLYERGKILPAIAVGDEAVRELTGIAFTDQVSTLKRWKKRHPNVDLSRPIRCVNCGQKNAASALFCTECSGPCHVHGLTSHHVIVFPSQSRHA